MSLLIRDLHKRFKTDDGKDFSALKNINLEITDGEFFTLLGPSGCGKTTLLRIIAGFERPSEGSLYFNGNDISHKAVYERNFPMVFQSYALFPHMSVLENIGYGLKQKGVDKNTINKKVNRIIEMTGLTPNKDKYPHQMSGGQQQRVALARAIVMEPEVMLFDEPLSNLDANLRISMREEIRRIQKDFGITVVYVTHDQEEAMAVSDKIVVMNHGVIEQVGSPIEIYSKPQSEFVANFVGQANILPVSNSGGNISILGVNYKKEIDQNLRKVISRPEFIKIDERGNHTGIITNSTYLGANWNLKVKIKDEEIAILAPIFGNKNFDVDQKISFSFDSNTLHFI